MATPRDQETKIVSNPPADMLEQDDAKALDTGEDAVAKFEETPRAAMMKKAREARAKEMGVEIVGDASKDRTDTSAADFKETPEEEKPEDKKPEEEEVPAHVAELADTDLVEIKVNGETKKMSWGDAKKSLQLGAATEETLAKAKDTKAAADAELVAARAARTVHTQEPAKAAEPTAVEKATAALQAAKQAKKEAHEKYTQAVRYGTDEEITKATNDLTAADDKYDEARDAMVAKPAEVDPEEVVQKISEQNESINSKRQTQDFLDKFADDQKDEVFRALHATRVRNEMFSDLTKLANNAHDKAELEDNLRKLTDREIGAHHFKARSRGLVRTLDKVFTSAGEQAREELKRRSAPTTQAADPRAERESKKQNTSSPPKAAAGRVPEPEADKPKTAKDIMAETKARRGKA